MLTDLKAKLSGHWGLQTWKLIFLGKCFFLVGSIALKLGVLSLHEWTPDFKPDMQKFTNLQVWVQFYLN